jgi:hypothetical protein
MPAAETRQRATQRPSAVACLPISPPSLTSHHTLPSSSSRCSMVHDDCSRCSSPCLAACTQVPLAGYCSSLLGRPCPPPTSCSSVFRCFISMFSSVKSGYCLCCNDYIHMLQVYVSSVSVVLDVRLKCFIWMLYNMHVASICFKCFIRMLQIFYMYVAKVNPDVACVCYSFYVFLGVLQLF